VTETEFAVIVGAIIIGGTIGSFCSPSLKDLIAEWLREQDDS